MQAFQRLVLKRKREAFLWLGCIWHARWISMPALAGLRVLPEAAGSLPQIQPQAAGVVAAGGAAAGSQRVLRRSEKAGCAVQAGAPRLVRVAQQGRPQEEGRASD